MLLVALSLSDDFILPERRAREWYGLSPDSAGRGLRGLKDRGLIYERVMQKAAPASPNGYTRQHHYTLMPPFGPRGVKSKTAEGVEVWNSGGKPPRVRRKRRRRETP